MSGWQPIETAPKDRPVLLACRNYRHEFVVVAVEWDERYGGHWDVSGTEEQLDYVEPTHWMPLPEPPK